MVISILIREAFYFLDRRQMESGQLRRTCKGQLGLPVQAEVMERMEATARMVLMEKLFPMHLRLLVQLAQ
jgi:hypothetical protein